MNGLVFFLRHFCTMSILILFASYLQPAAAQDVESNNISRPKIGLALSGGGARGAAHLGVLRVLEENNVPIDYIAGTSMGAIVGGLYAAGMTTDEIEAALAAIDWDDIFHDLPPRTERSFRRKRDDDLYLTRAKPGFSDGKLKLPRGLIQGQKIDVVFSRLALPVSTIEDFDDLMIPFRAVAADIATGEEVVIDSGNLGMAIRASMSIPAVFTPAEIYGRLLVDGGIVNNLPISIVRDMGADIVIAVDISTPLLSQAEIDSVLLITSQLTGLMTRGNVEEQIATLTEKDVFIVPDLGEVSTTDFKEFAKAIPARLCSGNGSDRGNPRFVVTGCRLSVIPRHLDSSRIADASHRSNQPGKQHEALRRLHTKPNFCNAYGRASRSPDIRAGSRPDLRTRVIRERSL